MTARDWLAELLNEEAAPGASSVALRTKPDELHLEVEGVGRLPLPVPPGQSSQLRQLGQRARFGRGTETLTDPEVRDTWEIPQHLIRAKWSDAFRTTLDKIRDGLSEPDARTPWS